MRKSGPGSPFQGMLLVYKEAGPSSNKVLQNVRRLLGGVKAGHAGTLDPRAEGLLQVCLGEATKVVPFLATLHKEYVGRMVFGAETESHDAWGKVVGSAPVEHLTRGLVEDRMGSFRGLISQIPPMYSAVKVHGERLYRLARRGEEVARNARTVEVKHFSILSWERPRMEFLVRCGSGTYVRTLCHDLGKSCGSAGHMTSLVRTAVGPFRVDRAITVEGLRKILEEGREPLPVIPLVEALPHLPLLQVQADEARRVRQGQPPSTLSEELEEDLSEGQEVRLAGPEGDLVAVVSCRGPGRSMTIRRTFGCR